MNQYLTMTKLQKDLYTKIEQLIILWSNDGTKTAGHLTRQIMEFLSENKQHDSQATKTEENS